MADQSKQRKGQLSPEEKRRLARQSLSDEDLFDSLVVDGMLEERLEDPACRAKWLPAESARSRSWFSKRRIPVAAGLAAAASVALYFLIWLPRASRVERAPQTVQRNAPELRRPVLGPEAKPGEPILLAVALTVPPSESTKFRGEPSSARLPNSSGVVLTTGEEGITVSLGSVDGLTAGTALSVLRSGSIVGTLEATTVFRDRSRARIVRGTIQVEDQVRVPPRAHLVALWERADALSSGGDHKQALQAATAAAELAKSANVSPRLRLEAQQHLAEAEFRAGDAAAARRRFQEIAAAGGETVGAWEALGVISLLSGDMAEAQRALERAESLASRSGSSAAHARALNNLAVCAEMAGDLAGAIQLFERALQMADKNRSSSVGDRRAIEMNLARIRKTE